MFGTRRPGSFAKRDEAQKLNASSLLGASGQSDELNDFRVDVSYYWQNLLGGTFGFFDTWGSLDPLLYASNSTATTVRAPGWYLRMLLSAKDDANVGLSP